MSEVIFFKSLEIIVEHLDGFFIAYKVLSSQKSFEFPEQMEVRRSPIGWIGWMWKQFKEHSGQFLLSDTAWMDQCIVMEEQYPFFEQS